MTRYAVGDPDPRGCLTPSDAVCGERQGHHYLCSLEPQHDGDHVAGTGSAVAAVWPNVEEGMRTHSLPPVHPPAGDEAMTTTTDTGFLQRQLAYAEQAVTVARDTVTHAELGMDYQWQLDALVRGETQVMLYRRALSSGVEDAAKAAVRLMVAPLGSSSTDDFANAIAAQKAVAAYEVIRFLAGVGLSYERLGELLATGR